MWNIDPRAAAELIGLSATPTRDKDDPSWRRPLEVERSDVVAFGAGSGTATTF